MKNIDNLKIGDTIGICAPSSGIFDDVNKKRLDEAIKQLNELGYNVIETESVRKDYKGRSNTSKIRANEFMKLWENNDVKLIIFATGGDYLLEMIDYLDFERIKNSKPKWIQGFSDITGLEFIFNTLLEIPSIYCDNVKSYAMKPLYRNLLDSLKIASGEKIIQKSFEKCEKVIYNMEESFNVSNNNKKVNPNVGYNLQEKVLWKNLTGDNKIHLKGRMIGGCLDVIQKIIGTKYDNVKNYISKYKNDGIIWYLENFETSSSDLTRTLWQLKNANYFDGIAGIVFGRPLFFKKEYDISYYDVIKQILFDLNIPIICDVDIGHVAPQMAIVNGKVMEIISKDGKGEIYYNELY